MARVFTLEEMFEASNSSECRYVTNEDLDRSLASAGPKPKMNPGERAVLCSDDGSNWRWQVYRMSSEAK